MCHEKNFENRSIFGEDIGNDKVRCFFQLCATTSST